MSKAEGGLKVCSRCQQDKPVAEFSLNKTEADGRQRWCRACKRHHYLDNREQILAKQKAYVTENRESRRATDQDYYQRNRDKIAERSSASYRAKSSARKKADSNRYNLLTRHGVDELWFSAALAAQGNACAICGTEEPGGPGQWHVDHDHDCCPGTPHCPICVRGLLCFHCNTALGNFGDSIDRLDAAIRYLRKYT